MSKRIGIFAGTFDPIHEGHLAFAQAALAEGLEKVMFLVEPRPRRKQGVRALEHRQAMVRLAIAKQPKLGMIILEQARFSVHETLPTLQARFKGYRLVFLFGDDVAMHMAAWPHVGYLMQAAELLIASRSGQAEELADTLQSLQRTRNLTFHYKIIQAPAEHVAASKIRLQIKRHTQAEGLVPTVQKYIARHHLYGSTEAK